MPLLKRASMLAYFNYLQASRSPHVACRGVSTFSSSSRDGTRRDGRTQEEPNRSVRKVSRQSTVPDMSSLTGGRMDLDDEVEYGFHPSLGQQTQDRLKSHVMHSYKSHQTDKIADTPSLGRESEQRQFTPKTKGDLRPSMLHQMHALTDSLYATGHVKQDDEGMLVFPTKREDDKTPNSVKQRTTHLTRITPAVAERILRQASEENTTPFSIAKAESLDESIIRDITTYCAAPVVLPEKDKDDLRSAYWP